MSAIPRTGSELAGETSAPSSLGAYALYAIVFVSGAVLMGVEIAGAKILAPSFGTSTFVWGSIIGLFMGALAAGYYLGGMLSDKKPSFILLSTIVSSAGVWIWLIPRFGPDLCETIAVWNLGVIVGPLASAFVVFFLPSFLMGMVSPYSVKLNASSMAGLGGVAGKLYALSTFGSIVGTLFTTFVLIPTLRVSTVMQLLGIILIFIAIVSLIAFKKATGKINMEDRTGIGMMALGMLLCAEVWYIIPVEPHLRPGERLLHYTDSSYHEILVTEDVIHQVDRDYNSYHVSQTKDIQHVDEWVMAPPRLWDPASKEFPWWFHDVGRWLKFNDNTESGIYPYREEYKNAVGYTDLLHLPLVWLHDPLPKKVLVVGGGGGIIPMQYHNWYGSDVTIAEIDPAVKDTATKFFQVAEVANGITFKLGDGRQTIKQLKDGDYDLIVLDAYSTGGQIPFHLLTWEFMANIRKKLSARGILVTNIISGIRNVTDRTPPPADLFLAEYKTLMASEKDAHKNANNPSTTPLFTQLYVFPRVYEGHPLQGRTLEEYRNVIIVATNEDKRMSIDDMAATIKELTRGEKPTVKVADLTWHAEHQWTPDKGPKKEELDSPNIPILTDDYAPVDTMYRPVKRDEKVRTLY